MYVYSCAGQSHVCLSVRQTWDCPAHGCTLGGLLNHCRTEQYSRVAGQSHVRRTERQTWDCRHRLQSASSITAGRNRQPLAGHSQTHREADVGLPAQVTHTLGRLLNHCRTAQTAVSRAESDTQRGRRGIAGTGYTYTWRPPQSLHRTQDRTEVRQRGTVIHIVTNKRQR